MILRWDPSILLWIQENFRAPWMDAFWIGITKLGDAGWFWIVTILLLLCFKKTRKIALMAALSLILCVVLNNLVLKTLVNRVRPYDAIAQLRALVPPLKDSSFPSGHTSVSFSVAWIYYLVGNKKVGIAALVLAALIGLSRLYVGVHYPSDVLVGMLLGSGCAFFVWKKFK